MNKTFMGALVGAVAIALPSAAFAQGTDDCVAPTPLSGTGAFVYDTTASTPSAVDLGGAPCEATMNEDVFFIWTATAAGTHVFGTCDATYDTQLQMGLGTDCAAICVANNDDACGLRSAIEIPGILAGDQYVIQVGAFTAGVVGAATLTIDIIGAPPANDTCATPDPISGLGSFPYSRLGATSSGFAGGDPVTCGTAQGTLPPHRDVFFAWTALAAGNYVFDNCGANNDVEINAHFGGDCTATCVANSAGAVCASNGEEQVTLTGVNAGDVYLIQVGDFGDTEIFNASGSLNVSVPPPPPANDTCATPTVIGGIGSFPYDRTPAFSSGFDGGDGVTTCLGAVNDGAGNRDIFFAWTPAASGNYTIDVSTEGNDTEVNIHLGADCTATCLVESDPSTFTFAGAVSGTTYLLQIGNWSATSVAAGPGTLDITLLPPGPANDTCATPVAVGLGTTAFDNTTAIDSGVGPCGAVIGNDMFYTFTVVTPDNYTFDTCGSSYDTEISVSLGADCSAICIASNDDGGPCTPQSTVDVAGALAGDTYLIRVGGWNPGVSGAGGLLNITVTPPPPPPPANDDCSTPTAISGFGSFFFDTTSATTSGFNGGEIASNGIHPCFPHDSQTGLEQEISNDVFFVWTAPCSGDFLIDTEGSATVTDTKINVHLGSDCTALCYQGDDDDGTGLLSSLMITGAVAGQDFLIQAGTYQATSTQGASQINITDLGNCPSSSITVVCDPASPHYLGNYAKMGTSSFGSGIGSDLHLEVIDGPAGEFGFILVSVNSTANLAIFNGVLCLGTPQGRYNPTIATNQSNPSFNSIGQFDGAGVLQSLFGNATSSGGSGYDVPLALPYSPAGQMIMSGDQWSFQCWYRDQIAPLPNPGSSANFSNAIDVVFP
tara:strand:- start:6006 stop:8669 length:2664 start_codon:yes stop_codon:yes gene_type:complete